MDLNINTVQILTKILYVFNIYDQMVYGTHKNTKEAGGIGGPLTFTDKINRTDLTRYD